MSPAEANAALGVVGLVGTLGLFMPGIDRAWSEDAHDDEARARLRMGESLYLGAALAVTCVAAYGQQSSAPIVLGFGLALLIVGAHEYALRRRSSEKDARQA